MNHVQLCAVAGRKPSGQWAVGSGQWAAKKDERVSCPLAPVFDAECQDDALPRIFTPREETALREVC